MDVHTFKDSGETTQGDGPGTWSRSGNYTDRSSVVERRKDTSTGPLTINGLTGPSAETTSTTHDEASSDVASYTANPTGRWPYGQYESSASDLVTITSSWTGTTTDAGVDHTAHESQSHTMVASMSDKGNYDRPHRLRIVRVTREHFVAKRKAVLRHHQADANLSRRAGRRLSRE